MLLSLFISYTFFLFVLKAGFNFVLVILSSIFLSFPIDLGELPNHLFRNSPKLHYSYLKIYILTITYIHSVSLNLKV